MTNNREKTIRFPVRMSGLVQSALDKARKHLRCCLLRDKKIIFAKQLTDAECVTAALLELEARIDGKTLHILSSDVDKVIEALITNAMKELGNTVIGDVPELTAGHKAALYKEARTIIQEHSKQILRYV